MVKGYPAILGFALLIRDNVVDLPALGRPTIPTSASILISSLSCFEVVCSPFSANNGNLLTGDTNHLFPLPPLPPRCKTISSLFINNSA